MDFLKKINLQARKFITGGKYYTFYIKVTLGFEVLLEANANLDSVNLNIKIYGDYKSRPTPCILSESVLNMWGGGGAGMCTEPPVGPKHPIRCAVV